MDDLPSYWLKSLDLTKLQEVSSTCCKSFYLLLYALFYWKILPKAMAIPAGGGGGGGSPIERTTCSSFLNTTVCFSLCKRSKLQRLVNGRKRIDKKNLWLIFQCYIAPSGSENTEQKSGHMWTLLGVKSDQVSLEFLSNCT